MSIDVHRGTSDAGDWCYVAWRPPDLGPLVDHLWAYVGPTQDRLKRVLPNGCVELIVNLAEPYRVGGVRMAAACVTGPLTGPLIVDQPVHQRCIAARLRPAGAHALLPVPVREVAGHTVGLSDLVGDVGPLVDRCAALDDPIAELRALADWIRDRAAGEPRVRPAIAWALHELDRTGGSCRIAALRERTGWSKGRFLDGFRDAAGLTPKLYGRIVRLRQTVARLQARGGADLGAVAFEGRFYDQPHMNAEFRALAGLTPQQFVDARHPVGDGSTAADRGLFSKPPAAGPSTRGA